MNSYIKSFMGTRLEVEKAVNEEAAKRKVKIASASVLYVNGVFYAYIVFEKEKEKATSERKRKATDC